MSAFFCFTLYFNNNRPLRQFCASTTWYLKKNKGASLIYFDMNKLLPSILSLEGETLESCSIKFRELSSLKLSSSIFLDTPSFIYRTYK